MAGSDVDYLLIHGTTQSAAGYSRLADALIARGQNPVVVDLPTDKPDWLPDEYAEFVATSCGALRSPVVVGHSGAGLLLPAIAATMNARRMMWLAAYVPRPSRSLIDELQATPEELFNGEWIGQDPTIDAVAAAYFLFPDCDFETLQWALTTVRGFVPQAAYSTPFPVDGLPDLPSTYVVCEADRTLRPDWQRTAAAERLQAEIIEIDAGHAPHVSRPDELADVLVATEAHHR